MQSLRVDSDIVSRWVDEDDLSRATTAIRNYCESYGIDSTDEGPLDVDGPRGMVNRLERDDLFQDFVYEGVISEAIEAASAVASLFTFDMPGADEPYQPMDRTTSDARYYRSLDGETWLIRPEDDGEIGFPRRMRCALTHVHNVYRLKRTEMMVPDVSVVVASDGDDIEVYTIMDRVGDLDAEPSHDLPIERYNNIGERLAGNGEISYFDKVSPNDFVPTGEDNYFVNPGQYRPGPSDRQLEDSPVVPRSLDEWSSREFLMEKAPYHFTATGQNGATVYKRGPLSDGRAPVA